MKPPTEKLYYYGLPGGATSGPLPLSTIQEMVNSGEIGAATHISANGYGGWMPLPPKPPEEMPQVLRILNEERSMSGALKVVGQLHLVGAGLGLLVILYNLPDGGNFTVLAVAAASCLVAAFLFFAASEVLVRLAEISRGVNRRR